MNYLDEIKSKALQLDFDLVGITDASPIDSQQIELLSDWLNCGYAGRMDFMHRNFKMRIDPTWLLQSAQSVICLALNYRPAKPYPPSASSKSPFGVITDYARYEDYHLFMKKKLHELALFISSLAGAGFKFKICVDSSPLAERALAARAGLGFIGKNHMLINPKLGPQILLGEIVTTLKLHNDEPIKANCSNCNKCLSACPTGALRPDGYFDANKCISYLTIEYKGQIPANLARKISNCLFGCDECVHACPYYQKAPPCQNSSFKFYPDRAQLDLHQLLSMSQADFDTKFADSPLMRVGLERLKRNAQICLSNITR
jgi:epoxyqueuosine reductase